MKRALIAVLVLFSAQLAAQTGAVVDYRLEVYDAAIDAYGTGDPIKSGTLPALAVVCNQAPPPALTLTIPNPHRIAWADPVNVGKVCLASTTLAIWFTPEEAVGHTYVVTITPVDDRGLVGARSGASPPFTITAPSAVTGLRVVP